METLESVCVDTDIIVDYLRGRQPGKSAFEDWRKKTEVSVTAITAFELLLGACLSSKPEERVREAESFLDQVGILSFSRLEAGKAAEKGAELKKKGAIVEVRDLFNASICLSKRIPILTGNRTHYERISGLAVQTP